MVVLAQLVRAPDCGSGGRRFEPGIPPQRHKASRFREAFFVRYSEKFTLSERIASRSEPGIPPQRHKASRFREAFFVRYSEKFTLSERIVSRSEPGKSI